MVVHGYARVAAVGQSFEEQLAALAAAGIGEELIVMEVSGTVGDKRDPLLEALLGRMEPGDVLAVARLDRLGRNPSEAMGLLRALDERGMDVRLLDLGVDTRSEAGRLVVGVLAAVVGWDRDVLRERTRQGIAAAVAAGTLLGRRHSLTQEERQVAARLAEGGQSIRAIARLLGVSKSAVHRAVLAGKGNDET